jgi:hypothetical protein
MWGCLEAERAMRQRSPLRCSRIRRGLSQGAMVPVDGSWLAGDV